MDYQRSSREKLVLWVYALSQLYSVFMTTTGNMFISFYQFQQALFPFFSLKGLMERKHFPPEIIYIVDKTRLSTVHNPNNAIAAKGVKQVVHMMLGKREINVTMNWYINATLLPWLLCSQECFLNSTCQRELPQGVSDSLTQRVSLQDFLKYFINHARPTINQKVILILDHHKSHVMVHVLNLAKKLGLVLLKFPTHTSHKLQSLDRGVSGPLKQYYNSVCGD